MVAVDVGVAVFEPNPQPFDFNFVAVSEKPFDFNKMSGLSVVGQDYYGVFPLKGKLLNVREASPKKLQEKGWNWWRDESMKLDPTFFEWLMTNII